VREKLLEGFDIPEEDLVLHLGKLCSKTETLTFDIDLPNPTVSKTKFGQKKALARMNDPLSRLPKYMELPSDLMSLASSDEGLVGQGASPIKEDSNQELSQTK
jgi:hypothetical protein